MQNQHINSASEEDQVQHTLPQRLQFTLFALAFGLWAFCFRGFLTGELMFQSDALAYYEHFKFFVDQLSRGVYPLWDPTREPGVPVDFFLRRIGSYNPMILLLILLPKCGIPFTSSYLIFLSLYYFLGMIGFYKLAESLFCDSRIAFIGFLLLMFSSLGTRLFDSYILLTFIPMVWFFYFILAFSKKKSKSSFTGIIFTLMILMTTYLPFYFFNILMTFVFCLAVLNGQAIMKFLQGMVAFIKINKVLAIICIIFLAVSLLPGVLFFIEASKGELDMPVRHHQSLTKNVMGVSLKTIMSWGIEEDVFYARVFNDFSKFKFAVLYVPYFAFFVFLMGLFVKASKRLVFLGLWGLIVYMTASPYSALYLFLYKHVFYFKFYRNLHFYLWIVLLPLFVLLVCEILKQLFQYRPNSRREKKGLLIWLILLHSCVLAILIKSEVVIATTIVSVCLSFIFFGFYYQFYVTKKVPGVKGQAQLDFNILLFAMIAIVLQPLEVYGNLSKNTMRAKHFYRYEESYLKSPLPSKDKYNEWIKKLATKKKGEEILSSNGPGKYLTTRWANYLYQNLRPDIMEDYMKNKFILYDHIEVYSDKKINLDKIGRSFESFDNVAYVPDSEPNIEIHDKAGDIPRRAEVVIENQGNFEVLKFDVNVVRLRTNFDSWRFLVYNDAYHSEWRAYIDGKRADLRKVNIAFKGLWVPSGEKVVEFRFGAPWRYWLNYSLLFVFYGIFLYLLFQWRRDLKSEIK